ncbi:DUF3068 domain-containing protein [Streptomyces sp. DSM 44917]|uniref:DUF3068 domain-containing protein n=1 Tax=Streptomyces boetiae TaxID=3075541 RepID=A0ABU2L9N5_9ACTN|nr:DUF3068 domain-containing protein [Streptomyces sp. DSM 44917]MDT0308281.1 DUF3068 domain-containing protein [Streptomyces sp. DSM 44917]
MRRTASPLSLILLGSGVFLLVLAPLLAWHVEPQARRTPLDQDTETVFTGTGSYFDTGAVETVEDVPLTITRRVRGDVSEGEESGHAVWDVSTTVDTEETLPADDPRDALQWTTERWVTDRETNLPVHCCGETPRFGGEAYLKFPFGVERRAYRWWDSTLGDTVLLEYSGTREVRGHEGLRFTATVEPTRSGTRQVPGVLVGLPEQSQVLAEEYYANHGIELIVDEETGRIIDAATGPRTTLRAPGSDEDAVVLLDSERLAFTPETQREQVERAVSDNDRLRLVGRTLPAGGAGAGAALALAGGVLVVRGRSPKPGRSPQTEEQAR